MKSKQIRRMFSLTAALGIAGAAWAAHYGQYVCTAGCTLNGPTPDGETVAFIMSTVNRNVERWKAGDTVEICNANTCVIYRMVSVMGGLAGGMKQISSRPRPGGNGGSGGGGDSAGPNPGGGGWNPPNPGGAGWGGGGGFGNVGPIRPV